MPWCGSRGDERSMGENGVAGCEELIAFKIHEGDASAFTGQGSAPRAVAEGEIASKGSVTWSSWPAVPPSGPMPPGSGVVGCEEPALSSTFDLLPRSCSMPSPAVKVSSTKCNFASHSEYPSSASSF